MKTITVGENHEVQSPFERLEATLAVIAHGALALAVLTLVLFYNHVSAAPFIPLDGKQVIERLPSRLDPLQVELRQLRAQLSKEPGNVALATNLARRYISLARSQADPRYLGYAEAALQTWWSQSAPPPEVRVLRATLRQSTHQFALALADLDGILASDRGNAQAWLTRATVQQVLGDYPAAKQSCAHLFRQAPDLVTQACLQSAASQNGDAAGSYQRLLQAFNSNPQAEADIKLWVLTLLAEMAERLGNNSGAEKHFRAALQATPEAGKDSYLLAAYADFLLQQGRPDEVVGLLANQTRADNLLLRYALALNQMKSPLAGAQVELLRQRFDAAMRRGDTVHQREQARFALTLQHDAASAMTLAQQNWQVQKEPADVLIMLEAAIANRQVAAAQSVLAWLKQSGLQDQRINALKQKMAHQMPQLLI
jgi:Tfp pilus assembly protein PilF